MAPRATRKTATKAPRRSSKTASADAGLADNGAAPLSAEPKLDGNGEVAPVKKRGGRPPKVKTVAAETATAETTIVEKRPRGLGRGAKAGAAKVPGTKGRPGRRSKAELEAQASAFLDSLTSTGEESNGAAKPKRGRRPAVKNTAAEETTVKPPRGKPGPKPKGERGKPGPKPKSGVRGKPGPKPKGERGKPGPKPGSTRGAAKAAAAGELATATPRKTSTRGVGKRGRPAAVVEADSLPPIKTRATRGSKARAAAVAEAAVAAPRRKPGRRSNQEIAAAAAAAAAAAEAALVSQAVDTEVVATEVVAAKAPGRGGRPKKVMALAPINIGIDNNTREAIAAGLSRLLADTYTLYLKTHNFHWNVTGPMFQTLHLMFETQYNELAIAVDAVAERIRALGAPAPGSYSAYAKLSSIPEAEGVPSARVMIQQLVEGQEAVVRTARSLFAIVNEASDEPTADLLTQRMQLHEKNAWMLRSLLAE